MGQNFLQLNESKGEIILFGSTTAVANIKAGLGSLSLLVKPQVRNLGVLFDSDLRFNKQVSAVVSSCFYQLRTISKIKSFLSSQHLQRVIIMLIFSRIDYCNSLLSGIAKGTINRLQLVMNAAARLLTRTKMREHITPVLASLHWLPVEYRIKFKTLMFVFKALNGLAPHYISELIDYASKARSLRSEDKKLLKVPRSNLVTRGDRAFAVAAPQLWNDLPLDIKTAPDLQTFKTQLKTHYCRKLGY